MHFSTIATSAALFGASAMATVYTYTSVDHVTITSCADYVTDCPAKTYSSSYYSYSTCTAEEEVSTTPVYASSTPVATYTSTPVYYTSSTPVAVYTSTTEAPVITYTSIDHVTITSCAPDVYSCPARTYSSTAYSTSTYSCPTSSPVYSSPVNYTTPVAYSAPATYTTTVISTICPGVNYCYATTVTSTYCPYSSTTPVSSIPYVPATSVPYVPATTSAYVCPGSPYCPVTTTVPYVNATTPVYTAPPVATGGASSSQVSFGVLAIAAIVGLFIAA